MFNRIGIIGIGMIGGSIAARCRLKGLANEVIGFDRDIMELEKGMELSIIDSYCTDLETGIPLCDMVVVATPVQSIAETVRQVKKYLRPGTILVDVGSVKSEICAEIDRMFIGNNPFVGCHPIAGKEKNGVEAADLNLLENEKLIITPTGGTNIRYLQIVTEFWTRLGMKVVVLNPQEHDRCFSIVSHLPHMIAFSFLSFVASRQKKDGNLLSHCGGSMRDFSRVGGSSPEVWKDIAIQNRKNIADFLEEYKLRIDSLIGMINREDSDSIMDFFNQSREVWKMVNLSGDKNIAAEDCILENKQEVVACL